MSTSPSFNERSIMTHAKVIDMDERPIISGEAPCSTDMYMDKETFGAKASNMLDSMKEKITHAFDNVKEAFTKSDSKEVVESKDL